MISNRHITEALLQNDRVVSCQFLGKGIFLLRMEGDTLPMKTNSYGVMKIVAPRNLTEEELDEHDMQCTKAEKEYYDDLDICDTVLE